MSQQQIQIPPELMAQALSFIVLIRELHEEGDIIEILRSIPHIDKGISIIEESTGKPFREIIDELNRINDYGELLMAGMRLFKPFLSESGWAELEKQIAPLAKQLHYVKSSKSAAILVLTNLFGMNANFAQAFINALMQKKNI